MYEYTTNHHALKKNTSLKYLCLRGNPLSDTVVDNLIESLKCNNTLEQLILTDCELSTKSMISIINAIPHLKGLKRLSIDGLQGMIIRQRKQLLRMAINGLQANHTLVSIHWPWPMTESVHSTKVALRTTMS